MADLTCECGRICRSPGGLASHQRSCLVHLDAVKVGTTQLELLPPGVGGRGEVEARVLRDLEVLHGDEALPDATESLQSAMVLLGRQLDRAELDNDRYGTINTARQLLATRSAIAPLGAPSDGSGIDEFFAEVSAKVRNTSEP